jgi:hypothetical protein
MGVKGRGGDVIERNYPSIRLEGLRKMAKSSIKIVPSEIP